LRYFFEVGNFCENAKNQRKNDFFSSFECFFSGGFLGLMK